MSNILIINPILYTAETNEIPKVDSIKDTMIYALCMGFMHGGHKVTLIAAQDYRPVKSEEYPFTVIYMKTVWHRVFLPRCFPYMPQLREFLREHGEYDLILSSEIFATWSYTAVRTRPAETLIWHELAAHNHMLRQMPSKVWYNIVARWLMRRALVVPRSEAAALFISQFMRRVSDTLVDHGVDLEKLERILCTENEVAPENVLAQTMPEKQFAVVSQLIDRKRIDRIIEAFVEFVSGGQEAYRLYIIGSGEQETKLRALVKERQVQEQVVFCGRMTHEQLLPIVAASQALLVYTSKDNNMVSIVESIAVGTPVVTTAVPYNAAYIRREALGIVQDDWTAQALREIVENNAFYRKNCLGYRNRLSNDYCAEQFLNICRKYM